MEFVSLRESLGTTMSGGKRVSHVFGAVAKFERELILERTILGLEAAKPADGGTAGRGALDEGKAKLARRLKEEGEYSVEEICSMLGVGMSTRYRYLSEDDHKEIARP